MNHASRAKSLPLGLIVQAGGKALKAATRLSSAPATTGSIL